MACLFYINLNWLPIYHTYPIIFLEYIPLHTIFSISLFHHISLFNLIEHLLMLSVILISSIIIKKYTDISRYTINSLSIIYYSLSRFTRFHNLIKKRESDISAIRNAFSPSNPNDFCKLWRLEKVGKSTPFFQLVICAMSTSRYSASPRWTDRDSPSSSMLR